MSIPSLSESQRFVFNIEGESLFGKNQDGWDHSGESGVSRNSIIAPTNKLRIRVCKRNHLVREQVIKFNTNDERDSLISFCFDGKYTSGQESLRASIKLDQKRDYFKKAKNSDTVSCFKWHILTGKELRDLISDYEIKSCLKAFNALLLKAPDCHEALFGLGKLLANMGKLDQALDYFKRASRINHSDEIYNICHSITHAKLYNQTKGEIMTSKSLLERCLQYETRQIDTIWAIMQLSVSSLVDSSMSFEDAEYYASWIKQRHSYYGYLAWSEVFIAKKEERKGVEILKALIEIYPDKPEAYLKLINFYYKNRRYENAAEIVVQAMKTISGMEYYVIFAIKHAKILYHLGKTHESLKWLQKKYEIFPKHIAYLYQYGRICVKSVDLTCIGSAIGALEECIKISDESRYGTLYYWLGKGQLLVRQNIEAFYSLKNSLKWINTNKKNVSEIKDEIRALNEHVKTYEIVEKSIANDTNTEELEQCKELCEDIRNFERSSGELLLSKILWHEGKEEEALNILETSARASSSRMNCYFQMIEYLIIIKDEKRLKTIAKEMINKCKNSQIPASVWVKAHKFYAKILVILHKPDKAINILKCLAQALPSLDRKGFQYTKTLKKAKNLQELLKVAGSVNQLTGNYCYFIDKINYPSPIQFASPRHKHLTQTPTSQAVPQGAHHRRKSTFSDRLTKHKNCKRFDSLTINSIIADLEEDKQSPLNSEIPVMTPTSYSQDNFCGLFVCSDVTFLYKIGKISANHKLFIEDGLCALDDFIEFLKYETQEDYKDRMTVKAHFWKSLLMMETLKSDEGLKLLQEITPDLYRLKLKKEIAKSEMLHYLEEESDS
ncbi:unnamed protein product [Blepharisma stoltei]|uniref:Tetratricopeptide repeat protein n=1 Tax=Blepharisma stoltei TaxID=1481888 RepID=A0AAU9KIQ3_9CILI|nr:unnamed protein product [Blepharisma stoltei]